MESALDRSEVVETGAHRISWVGPASSRAAPSRWLRGGRRVVRLALGAAALAVLIALGLVAAVRIAGSGQARLRSAMPVEEDQVGRRTDPGRAAPVASAAAAAVMARVYSANAEDVRTDGGLAANARDGGSARLGSSGTSAERPQRVHKPAAPDVRMGPSDRYGRFE